MHKIETRKGMIEWLGRVSREYETLDYNWDRNVYRYILWSMKKWNIKHSDECIYLLDLGISEDYLNYLKGCFFGVKQKVEL